MRVVGRLSLLLLLLSGTVRVPAAVAQSADPPAEPPAPASGVPVPAVPSELDQRHQDFLAQVAPLMSDKEREVFLSLQQDYQRDTFIRRFWQARDPYPQTAVNEFQARWEESARTVRERFPDPKDDRIEALLAFGEPADTVVSRCSDVLLPTEVWLYSKGTQGVRGSFAIAFYSPLGASRGRYQLWVPGDGLLPLLSFEARARAGPGFGLHQLAQSCSGGGDLVAGALSEAIDWREVVRAGAALPKPTDEWLRTFQSYSTDLPGGAGTFAAELDLSYPGRQQSRTVVQGLLAVPREAVQPLELGGSRLYAFLVDGEVVRKGELFEHFRYRFTMPEKEALALGAGQIPVVFQRLLRPGAYTLVLKVEDLGGKRFFRAERELEVPVTPTVVAAAPSVAPGTPESAGTAGQPPPPGSRSTGDLLAEANATVAVPSLLAVGPDIRAGGEATVQLVSPGDGLLTGRTRIQAVTTGDAVARVSFELDGKPVLAKSKPPWSIEIGLGDQPRLHRVVAVAYDGAGGELARDELLLNAGPHRFAARLVEPQRGRHLQEQPAGPRRSRRTRGRDPGAGRALPQRQPGRHPLPAAVRAAHPAARRPGAHLRARRRLPRRRHQRRGPGGGQRPRPADRGRGRPGRAVHHRGRPQGPAGRRREAGGIQGGRGRRRAEAAPLRGSARPADLRRRADRHLGFDERGAGRGGAGGAAASSTR